MKYFMWFLLIEHSNSQIIHTLLLSNMSNQKSTKLCNQIQNNQKSTWENRAVAVAAITAAAAATTWNHKWCIFTLNSKHNTHTQTKYETIRDMHCVDVCVCVHVAAIVWTAPVYMSAFTRLMFVCVLAV